LQTSGDLTRLRPHPASFLGDPLLVKERVREEGRREPTTAEEMFLFRIIFTLSLIRRGSPRNEAG